MTKSVYDYQVNNRNYKENKQLRVAMYTRVSTNDQFLNGAGMESQRNEINDRIKSNKEKFLFNKKLHHYEDGAQSGATEHRPELDRMMNDIERGEIDIIIVYKIDRLFRKLLYLLQFIEKISKSGVFIISIKDNIDTSDSMGMVMLQFMGIIGDIERDNIRMRTIDGKITKAKKGYYVGGGKIPYGFWLKGTPGGKKAIVDSDEAKVINRIFDLYVNKNTSLGGIAKILTNEGIPTRDDKLKSQFEKYNKVLDNYRDKEEDVNEEDLHYQKGTKKENDGRWYASTIRKILKNKMHRGLYEYGKTTKEWNEVEKKFKIINNPPEKIVEFTCDKTLKDTAIFYEAQELLEKNIVSKSNTSKYLFSGLINCGVCGFSYNGYTSSKKTFNYRCKGGMSGSTLKPKCKNSDISEELLFDYCWSELDRNLSNPDNFKSVVFDEEKNKEVIADLNRRINTIFSLLKTKNNNLESAIINELETDNETKKAIYNKKIAEYEDEIRLLKLEDNELRREISIIKSNEKKRDDIKDFNEEHEKAVKNLTKTSKRGLIKKYVKMINRNPGKLKIRFNILDELEGKDWRDGEDGEDKKLKSQHDFFNVNSISIRDVIKNMGKKK